MCICMNGIFCFQKGFFNFSYYIGKFLVGANRLGVPFTKLHTFFEIFWALPIDYIL